jgi:hypothetical protein
MLSLRREVRVAGKPGALSEKPTELPDRYERLFAWALDRRCKAVREIAGDLLELWQDLGGVDSLPAQKKWLCERVVYLRRRCLAYESAVLAGAEPPMDAGCYSNHANVLQGYLRTLGIERRARTVRTLRQHLEGQGAALEGSTTGVLP